MPITRHHTGRWLYQFDRIIAGQRTRANRLLPEGTTRAEAFAFDQRETRRLWQIATGGEKPEPLIADAVLLYLKEHAPKLKNFRGVENALGLMLPHYTGKPFSALPDIAIEYAKHADVKPATVHNRLAYLRAACRWAWKAHKMGEHDPAERMTMPVVNNARQVYLTRADMLRIARAMGLSWSRDVARVAFYTGMRAGEVLRSQPVEAGGEPALSVADTKNGQPRIIPVHPKIAHLVRGQWPPMVTVWTASKATKAAMRAVGLGHARLHDLRHSAASEMVNAGVPLHTVGEVLGHKSQVSTARYSHLAAATLKGAVLKIGGKAAKSSQPRPNAKAA